MSKLELKKMRVAEIYAPGAKADLTLVGLPRVTLISADARLEANLSVAEARRLALGDVFTVTINRE